MLLLALLFNVIAATIIDSFETFLVTAFWFKGYFPMLLVTLSFQVFVTVNIGFRSPTFRRRFIVMFVLLLTTTSIFATNFIVTMMTTVLRSPVYFTWFSTTSYSDIATGDIRSTSPSGITPFSDVPGRYGINRSLNDSLVYESTHYFAQVFCFHRKCKQEKIYQCATSSTQYGSSF